MTRQEVDEIRFSPISHLALEDRHPMVYKADFRGHDIFMCSQVPTESNKRGKTTTHYMIAGIVYKSKEEFYKARETILLTPAKLIYKTVQQSDGGNLIC